MLLAEGEVVLTRDGRKFPLKLLPDKSARMGIAETSDKIFEVIKEVAASIPDDRKEEAEKEMTSALETHRAQFREDRNSWSKNF